MKNYPDEEAAIASATDTEAAFLTTAYAAAKAAQHVWPAYAACEAALDSDYGRSDLATKANNLFNMRAPAKLQQGQKIISVENSGKLATDWLAFDSPQECFATRMAQIQTVPMFYLARRALTQDEYLEQMGKLQTDALRVGKVQAIYLAHKAELA